MQALFYYNALIAGTTNNQNIHTQLLKMKMTLERPWDTSANGYQSVIHKLFVEITLNCAVLKQNKNCDTKNGVVLVLHHDIHFV